MVIMHVMAELTGISGARLHDRTLLGGLLIAAAGAAGLHAAHSPILQSHEGRGVDGLLMLESGHVALHAFAEQRTLLIDIVALESGELDKALAVFTRRLAPSSISVERAIRMTSA